MGGTTVQSTKQDSFIPRIVVRLEKFMKREVVIIYLQRLASNACLLCPCERSEIET